MLWVPTDTRSVVYGPLRDMPVDPSVILLRLNGKQQMLMHDAWPRLRFEGKPQCHEAISTGFARGRTRKPLPGRDGDDKP
jgi:hypothetical protein